MKQIFIVILCLFSISLACDLNPNKMPLIKGEAKLIAHVDNG